MKTLFIDLHVHTTNSQERCANLSAKDTLNYFQQIGLRSNKRVIIRINDHDNFYGGVEAMEEFLANREDYPNLFVIPGMECNVSLNYVLKYEKPDYKPDPKYPNSDDKYKFIFKKAHVGVTPILSSKEAFDKWKNSKGLQVYSKLSKMFLDLTSTNPVFNQKVMSIPLDFKEQSNLTNLGEKLIGCKNIIRQNFGIIIPFEKLEPCVEFGLTNDQIIDRFYEVCSIYMMQNSAEFKTLKFDQAKSKLKKVIGGYLVYVDAKNNVLNALDSLEKAFKNKLPEYLKKDCLNLTNQLNSNEKIVQKLITFYINTFKQIPANKVVNLVKSIVESNLLVKNKYVSMYGKQRIHFDELAEIVYKAGGVIDIEHPDKSFEIHTDAIIPTKLLKEIDLSLLKSESALELINNNAFIDVNDVLAKDAKADYTGMIRLQLLRNAINNNPDIKLTNNFLGAEIPKRLTSMPVLVEKILDIMAKAKILPSLGIDKHMNTIDDLILKAKHKEFTDKDGKLINDEYVQDWYERYKSYFELHDKFTHYTLPEDKTTVTNQYDYVTKQKNFIKAHSTNFTQLAYLDVVLGKQFDFEKSSLATFKPGAIVNESLDNPIQILINQTKSKLLKDIFEYSNFDLKNQDEEKKKFLKIIAKKNNEKLCNAVQGLTKYKNIKEILELATQKLIQENHKDIDMFLEYIEENKAEN